MALALKSFHCNNTLNKQKDQLHFLCAIFSTDWFLPTLTPKGPKIPLDKRQLLLPNRSKMKAASAKNEMLKKNMPSVTDEIYTCFDTFPGNSANTQNLPAGTTLPESAQPLDWDTAGSLCFTLCSCLILFLTTGIDN